MEQKKLDRISEWATPSFLVKSWVSPVRSSSNFSPARYADDATAVRPELRLTVLVEQ